MSILERVAELHRADAIKLAADLKKVDDFYELIRDDLMVGVLYEVEKRGCLVVRSIWGSGFTVSLMRELRGIDKENIYYVLAFNDNQEMHINKKVRSSLVDIKLKLSEKEYTYYHRCEITKAKGRVDVVADEGVSVKDVDSAQDDKYAAIAVLIVVAIIAGCTAYAHFL